MFRSICDAAKLRNISRKRENQRRGLPASRETPWLPRNPRQEKRKPLLSIFHLEDRQHGRMVRGPHIVNLWRRPDNLGRQGLQPISPVIDKVYA